VHALTLRSKNLPLQEAVHAYSLAAAEAALDQREAIVQAQWLEVSRREEHSRRAFEQAWQALGQLRRALGTPAIELGTSFPAIPSETPPERQRADELRQAALAARSEAVAVEEHLLRRREEALERVGEILAGWQGETDRLRAELTRRADEERQRAESERQAETARQAKAPSAPPAETVERRRAPRVSLHTEVTLSSDSNFYTGFTTDLSDGGIFVATCAVYEPGTEVKLRFSLPGSGSIETEGIVRWTREYNEKTPDIFPGMGIEFASLSMESHAAIAAFTQHREPLFY